MSEGMTVTQELRAKCDWCMPCKRCTELQKQAADEIERLRAQLARGVAHARERVALVGDLATATAEIERLRALIDATAKEWLRGCEGIPWEGAIDAAMAAAVREIERLRAENESLKADPQWYWDDNALDHAIAADEIGEYEDVGDIVELRPIRELPTVWMLVTVEGPYMFATKEEAEAARAAGGDS